MGACQFQNTGRGKSAKEAYSKLVEYAQDEYGYDSYNGTISTTHGFRDVTDEWKNSKKDLNKFIDEKFDVANKYDCFCICIKKPVENTNKTKSQVEHFNTSGTKKWLTVYVVSSIDGEIGSYDTKGDAVKAARAHTEKYLSKTTVAVEKRIQGGTHMVARITYKRSTTEKDGEWIFFGWAAE